jgi:hypothetical protein
MISKEYMLHSFQCNYFNTNVLFYFKLIIILCTGLFLKTRLYNNAYYEMRYRYILIVLVIVVVYT